MPEQYKSRRTLLSSMRHQIKFYRSSDTDNSAVTSIDDTETLIWTTHASIMRASGSEVETAQRRTGLYELMFTCRYHDSIDDVTLQIEHRGDRYDIQSIHDIDGDYSFMEILAQRRK